MRLPPGFASWLVEYLQTGQVPEDENALNLFELIEWQYHGASRNDPVLPAWTQLHEHILPEWI